METGTISHRAVAAGISGGLGVLLPAAAYVVTLPLEGVHQAISSVAMPFAAGILAGVGAYAVSSYVLDAPAGSFGQLRSRDRRMGGAAAAELEGEAAPQQPAAMKGVPVITRAAGALSDDEAWAELDALLAEDSPVSCDPTRSKDLYQIALEELRSGQHAAEVEALDEAQVEAEAEVAGAAESVAEAAAEADADVEPGLEEAAVEVSEPVLADEPMAAAVADDAEPEPAIASEPEPALEPEPEPALTAVIALAAESDAQETSSLSEARPEGAPSPDTTGVYLRLVADYSRREAGRADASAAAEELPAARGTSQDDIWAQALAIMAEPLDEPVPAAEADEEREVPRPHGAHFALPADSAVTRSFKAQTGDDVMMRMHVDKLVEEEISRLRVLGSYRRGRENFRVFDGGTTAVLPRATAEA